jgi:hypothetical protein
MENNDVIKNDPQMSYETLLLSIGNTLRTGRTNAARAISSVMVHTYWEIGRQIVEFEQGGNERAEYGTDVLNRLSKDLTARYGSGFSRSNVHYIRKLYLTYPKVQTLSELSWSHYIELLKIEEPMERSFYEKECCNSHWGVRELKRQIKSMLYHRILKCFVLIDLKRGESQHEDIGQMNFYLNYYREEMNTIGDTEPIGIILGAYQDKLVMQYALQNISNQVFVSRYQLYLPEREQLEAEVHRFMGR